MDHRSFLEQPDLNTLTIKNGRLPCRLSSVRNKFLPEEPAEEWNHHRRCE